MVYLQGKMCEFYNVYQKLHNKLNHLNFTFIKIM